MPSPRYSPAWATSHPAQASATVRLKGFCLNDCSDDLDSIFVKHRLPRKKLNK